MNDSVRQCVAPRADFFGQYCEVPPALQGEVDAFLADLHALAESSTDAAAFEAAFVSGGLSDRFHSLISRCTPKAYQMTAQDKAYSRQVAKEMLREDKGRILQEAASDVGESISMKVESDMITARNRAMSEAGVLDDYTRLSNNVEYAKDAAGLLGKLFKKKKNR
jgi:hypothetical protein